MSYTFNLPQEADVTWQDAEGNEHTQQVSAGEEIIFENPCEAYNFIQSYLSETGAGYNAQTEAAQFGQMRAACQGGPTPDTVTETTEAPTPITPDVADEPGDDEDSLPPGSSNPPSSGTDPESLGAELPQTASSEQPNSAPQQPDPGRPREQQAHDPQTPQPSDVPTDTDGGHSEERQEQIQRNDPTPGLPHYEFGLNDDQHHHHVADPVDLFSGTFGLMETDFEIPGARFPLKLIRRYRSGVPYFGPWGYNWDHNHNSYLRPLNDQYVAVWTGLINEDVYIPQADGSWKPPLGVVNRLTHQMAGPMGNEEYRVTTPDGTVYLYTLPDGWSKPDRLPLVRMQDRFGNGHSYHYDTAGRLAMVEDDHERHLVFHYGHCDFLEGVEDHTGRRIRYWHDEDRAHLVQVFQPDAADDVSLFYGLCYEYDTHEIHGRLRHNITRVIDEAGETRLYNVYGKDPMSSDFARVVTQYFAGHRADFRYTRLMTPTRVPDAINLNALWVETIVDGDYSLYTFNFRGNLLEKRYRLARDSSYRLYVEAYRYDAWGNMSLSARPNGYVHHYTYDVDSPDPAAWRNLLEVDLEAPPSRPSIGRRVMRMTYEPDFQLLSTHEDESMALTRYHYDHQTVPGSSGALIRVQHPDATLPDGAVQTAASQYEVNAAGQVTLEISPEGRSKAYEYDQGWLVAIIDDPDNLAIRRSFEYDPFGNTIAHIEPGGSRIDMEYDVRNRLVRALKPEIDGQRPQIILTYNRTGQLETHRRPGDGDDIVTTYEYDTLGRLVSQINASGTSTARQTQYCYDAWDRIIKVTDHLGREEKHTYDERGRLLTLTRVARNRAERVVQWIHDLNGQTIKTIYPDETTTEYVYDAWDRPLHVIEQAYTEGRQEKTYIYGDDDLVMGVLVQGPDGHGNPVAILEQTTYDYDERGRVRGENTGMGTVIHFYDADGLLTALVDPSGARTSRTFDARGRLVHMQDDPGNQMMFDWDEASRLTRQGFDEMALDGSHVLRETLRTYNARHEQVTFTDPSGHQTQFEYDAAGRLVNTVSPMGAQELRQYNVHGELTGTLAMSGAVQFSRELVRDEIGRIVEMIDDTGASVQYEYDDFDALISQIWPDGQEEMLSYAASGRLMNHVRPSGTLLDYSYRADGQLAAIEINAGAGLAGVDPLEFTRDGMGRLTRVVQGGHEVQRHYDAAGRLVSDALNGAVFERGFDNATGLERLLYPDGREDQFEFDLLGRLRHISLVSTGSSGAAGTLNAGDDLIAYGYEGFSRPVQRELLNGVTSLIQFDEAERLRTIEYQDSSAATLATFDCDYNQNRHRTSLDVGGTPGGLQDYAHNNLGHVTQAQMSDWLDEYTVNGADSRQSLVRTEGGTSTGFAYTTNARHQIVSESISVGGGAPDVFPYLYSADGHCLQDRRHTYIYNAMCYPIEIQRLDDGSSLLGFEWDPLGRLVRVFDGAGRQVSLLHLNQRLMEEETLPGGQIAQHTYGALPAERVLTLNGAQQWCLQDARGSEWVWTDQAGQPSRRMSFDIFGTPTFWNGDLSDTGGVETAPAELIITNLFGGMHYLPDAGLYLAGNRLYDPQTGLFLQPDSAGMKDSTNLYAYCHHNPVDFIDRDGQYIESAWDVFSLGVGVASLSYNLTRDEVDWWSVGLDVVGIVADSAALILPGVPGGAGAAIRASRAASTGVEAVSQVTRVGRAVRYTQAAHGGANAVRGVHMSYEAAREGNYGTAAFGIGLSALGIRGSLSRFHTARIAGRSPSSLYSMQGNAGEILQSGRIWGMTEGRVWAIPQAGAGAARTGMSAADMPPMQDRLIIEFTEGAQDIFRPHTVWGPFTAWKAYAGQHVTALGDVTLGRIANEVTFDVSRLGYFARVTDASHSPLTFAGQSVMRARARAAFPIAFDSMLNIVPASMAAMMGLADSGIATQGMSRSGVQFSTESHGGSSGSGK